MDLKIKQTPGPFTCLYVFFLSPNLVMPFPHLSLSDLASCCIHRVVFVLIYIHCNPEIALRLQMFCKKLVYRPPSLFGKIGSSRGNVPYLDIICTTLRLCNIVGEGGKASLSATSYPIQPTRLPSEQHEHQRKGTHNLAADKGLVNQSINQLSSEFMLTLLLSTFPK